ncbi:unnamed protein product [Symbiodinium natans]|uniref:Uncharacterized protein n=1 Tax=Symbiodinium natans TaxID=878477 RepID=A0A812IGQ0_9DINO|nr:unnamed protein product [Symbiodinium natans]
MLDLALGMVKKGRFADDLVAGLEARVGRRPSGGSVVLQPTPNSSPIWDKRGFKKKGLDSKYLAKQIPGSGVGDANVCTRDDVTKSVDALDAEGMKATYPTLINGRSGVKLQDSQAALQAQVAKLGPSSDCKSSQAGLASKEATTYVAQDASDERSAVKVQTVQEDDMPPAQVQEMLQALEAQVYDLSHKLEASESRCADLWRQNTALQLTVERIMERERSTASSCEAEINTLKEQLQLGRAEALEEQDRSSSRICALHGKVEKSSCEAAELERRLKEESDKVEQLEQQVQVEKDKAAQLEQQLQEEKDKAVRFQKQREQQRDEALDPVLLQQEKEKAAKLEQQLQVERAKVAKAEEQWQEEKDKAAKFQQQLLQQRSEAMDPMLLQQEKAKVARLEQQLQEEKDKAEDELDRAKRLLRKADQEAIHLALRQSRRHREAEERAVWTYIQAMGNQRMFQMPVEWVQGQQYYCSERTGQSASSLPPGTNFRHGACGGCGGMPYGQQVL